MQGQIIAVANRKGGVGKTTTTVNLAACFSEQGYRTLLVDMDTQGHAGAGLGLNNARRGHSLHDIFVNSAVDLTLSLQQTCCQGLDVIPANPYFEAGSGPIHPLTLRQAIEKAGLTRRYDVILIDTGPALDAFLINALCAATAVVVPFIPHPLAAEGIAQFSRLFMKVRTKLNPALRLLALVPVQINPTIRLHRQILQQLAQQFGAEKLLGAIRTDIRLAEAFAARQPVIQYASGSRGAADYRELTSLLQAQWQTAPAATIPAVTAAQRTVLPTA